MAYAKKTDTTATKVENKESTVDNENVLLKQQIEEMKAQMALMSQMIANQQPKVEKQSDPNKRIEFINLTHGTLVLRGSRIHEIVGQFNKRDFSENEAQLILNNSHNAVVNGLVYIADADFVKENNLTAVYESLLNDNDLKTILNQNANKVIEIYQNCNESQRKIILNMVENQQLNTQDVDANILMKLSELSKKDLMRIGKYDEE